MPKKRLAATRDEILLWWRHWLWYALYSDHQTIELSIKDYTEICYLAGRRLSRAKLYSAIRMGILESCKRSKSDDKLKIKYTDFIEWHGENPLRMIADIDSSLHKEMAGKIRCPFCGDMRPYLDNFCGNCSRANKHASKFDDVRKEHQGTTLDPFRHDMSGHI